MATLSSIRLPSEAATSLHSLSELDEAHGTALVEALSSGEIGDRAGLITAVNGAVGDVWEDEAINAFVTHLVSISTLGTSHNFKPDALADAFADKASADIEGVDRETLRLRLAALLNAPDLVVFSKAVDISSEFDNLVHLVRILTDIRPVFGTEPSEEPLGALIVHTLKVDYFHAGRMSTLSFALNPDSLAELKKSVERAVDKEGALSSMLQRWGLPEIDIVEDTE